MYEHQHDAAARLAIQHDQGGRSGESNRRAALERSARRPAVGRHPARREKAGARRARHKHVQANAGGMMSARKLGSITCILVALARLDVAAQRGASNPPDITGAYERYGNIFGPRTEAQQKDPTIPPANPPPPLKPEYLKQWQARVQAAREAEAKGQPLATGYTHCLPDGMPSMMAAMFPIEFLQSKGQVTVIEEAFTQIRRILLDRPQKTIDDVEPGFYGRSVGHWEGDTLVVDTVGVKESVRYQNLPHS